MWIGLNDIKHEGTFTWEVDESDYQFSNWGSEQPENNNKDCVTVRAINKFGLWNDYQCDRSHLYMCEKPANGMLKDILSYNPSTIFARLRLV